MEIIPNNELSRYVAENLSRELADVKLRNKGKPKTILNLEEQTLIYKYTEDGYERLNENLRTSNGKIISEYGQLLAKTLAKLPNFEDVVYRAADLTPNQLRKYQEAKEKNRTLVEHSFISCSKSDIVAYQFGAKCQFIILSKTGKNIEEFAKYGIDHFENEKEVLFCPNIQFKVLTITKQDHRTLIRLEEIIKE